MKSHYTYFDDENYSENDCEVDFKEDPIDVDYFYDSDN